MSLLPCAFIAHGSPGLLQAPSPWSTALGRWAADLAPRALLVVSARWRTPAPTFTGGRLPGILHDFIGFPPPLYETSYPAQGSPDLVLRALDLLGDAAIAGHVEPQRPLDHGVWAPLTWMYPRAPLPVVQMSLPHGATPAALARLGLALAPLRSDGVLILGSGGMVHNLQRVEAGATAPEGWARTFDQWMARHLWAGDLPGASAYRAKAPYADLAMPRPEQLAPLFVAWGAADGAAAAPIYEGWEQGNLSLRSVAWTA